MSGDRELPIEPPARTRLLLRLVLPCDGMREAIFGDLHEEFVRDVRQIGPDGARRRYRDRVIGIFAHAVWDSFRWRTWASSAAVSSDDAANVARAGRSGRADPDSGRFAYALARAGRVGGLVGLAIAAFGVLVLGIYVNTYVFTALGGGGAAGPPGASGAVARAGGLPDPLVLLAIGVGGVAFMVACSAIAAFVICLAPRWRRGRPPAPPGAGR